MTDSRTEISSAYGLRLAADLLTAMVATGAIGKEAAQALIDDGRRRMLADFPDHAALVQQIAATLTGQVQAVSQAIDRQLDR